MFQRRGVFNDAAVQHMDPVPLHANHAVTGPPDRRIYSKNNHSA